MANKIIITWDSSETNITLEGEKPVPSWELIGVLEYAKLLLNKRERQIEGLTMKTIEDKIQEILAEHHECRWMDSSELENCLRRVAERQKAIDDRECETMVGAAAKEVKQVMIDKVCEWLKFYVATFTETPSMLEDFKKAMED